VHQRLMDLSQTYPEALAESPADAGPASSVHPCQVHGGKTVVRDVGLRRPPHSLRTRHARPCCALCAAQQLAALRAAARWPTHPFARPCSQALNVGIQVGIQTQSAYQFFFPSQERSVQPKQKSMRAGGMAVPPARSLASGFNLRGTRALAGAPCVKVPGSSRVPAPTWVGSRSLMCWWFGLAPATLRMRKITIEVVVWEPIYDQTAMDFKHCVNAHLRVHVSGRQR